MKDINYFRAKIGEDIYYTTPEGHKMIVTVTEQSCPVLQGMQNYRYTFQ